jgi:hypothetical protein
MRRVPRGGWLLVAVLPFIFAAWLDAQDSLLKKYRRARPPAFDSGQTSGIFFDDVFQQAVEGVRPGSLGSSFGQPGSVAATPLPDGGNAPSAGGSPDSQWSKLISGATIEDIVKAAKLEVDKSVTTPTQFRSRDYRSCRKLFTVLALMFAVIEEFDGDVRWKQQAPALRQAFARAAANCKTGSDQAYNEAKLRKLDLQDVIGGGSVNLPDGKPRENWETVCDRSPLMQILEMSLQQQLQPNTANQAAFQASHEDLYREAQLVAVIGLVLKQDGMMDAGDEEYNGFCDQMTTPSVALVEAIKSNSHDQAVSAVGQISQACSACHELYR